MLFTLSQLEYIVAVDTYRSFSEAARHCSITQPTLSMQIQKMEDLLEVTLFDRSRQPILPTDVGQRIITQARIILKESNCLEQIAAEEHGDVLGEFHLGIIPTVAPYLLPRILLNFRQRYPKVRLTIDELQTHQIIDSLQKDRIDAGILATPLKLNKMATISLYYEPFYVYLSPDHKLSRFDRLRPDQITAKELLLLEEGHCFRGQSLLLCQKRSKEERGNEAIFGTGNLEVLKKLADRNFGITLLPDLMVRDEVETEHDRIRPFESPTPSREVSVIYARSVLKQSVIHALVECVKASLPADLLSREGKQVLPVEG